MRAAYRERAVWLVENIAQAQRVIRERGREDDFSQLMAREVRRMRKRLRTEVQGRDPLAYRAKVATWLEEFRFNRVVHVYVWGRDCDMCESDSVSTIPCNVIAYEKFCAGVWDGAEGPTSIYPISYEEALEFQPSFRDRALEAFENGRGNAVYV